MIFWTFCRLSKKCKKERNWYPLYYELSIFPFSSKAALMAVKDAQINYCSLLNIRTGSMVKYGHIFYTKIYYRFYACLNNHFFCNRWKYFVYLILVNQLSPRRKTSAFNLRPFDHPSKKVVQSPKLFICFNLQSMNPLNLCISIWITHINPTT